MSGTNIKTVNNQSLLGSGNISISGGTSTDVQINGTSITSGGTANIVTKGTYNSSTNKIATMDDVNGYDATWVPNQNGTVADFNALYNYIIDGNTTVYVSHNEYKNIMSAINAREEDNIKYIEIYNFSGLMAISLDGTNIQYYSYPMSYEMSSNKVTSISSSSTDTQYPSAKAVYTYANNKVINNNHLTDNTSQTYSGKIIEENFADLSNMYYLKDNIATIQFSIIIPSGTVEETFPIDFPTGFSKNNSVILSAMWSKNPSAESAVWQPLYNNYFVDDNTIIPQFKIELGDTSNENPNKINLTFSSPDSTPNVIARDFKVTLMKHDAISNTIY